MKIRTHTCGELNKDFVNQSVLLNGWISKVRDLGSVIFADLRDRYGKTQLVFNADINQDSFNNAKKKNEKIHLKNATREIEKCIIKNF